MADDSVLVVSVGRLHALFVCLGCPALIRKRKINLEKACVVRNDAVDLCQQQQQTTTP